jgi:hypothetical protein
MTANVEDKRASVSVDGRMMLKWILENLWGGRELVYLAEDGDKLRAAVKTVVEFRAPHNAGNFLTS